MFTVTRATPSQAEEIATLYVRTRRAAYAFFFPPEPLAEMSVSDETDRWHERLTEECSETIIAVDGAGAIAGFAHIAWDDDASHATGERATGEIEYMYVATEHQGVGLGARLIAEAEAALAAAGMGEAILWVYELNTPARGFYERCGWAWDGATKASNSAPGQRLARYRKQLKLPESL